MKRLTLYALVLSGCAAFPRSIPPSELAREAFDARLDGEPARAIRLYESAAKNSEQAYEYYVKAGLVALEDLHDVDKATELFIKGKFYSFAANLYLSNRNFGKAVDMYERAAEQETDIAVRRRLYSDASQFAERAGDSSRAADMYRKAQE